MHPHRSKEAFSALIGQWQGILVSDGYGVYQSWAHLRQACLAHLMRTARGLAEKRAPKLAACGRWALAIPVKRTDQKLIGYLTRPEIQALLAAPDRATWVGRRNHALQARG